MGAHTVVRVSGELDVASAPELRDSVLGLLNRGVESLVIDLRGVTFIDSTGVGSLLRIHHRQGLLGGRIHFVADQPSVLRVLDALALTRRLAVVPTVADCSAPVRTASVRLTMSQGVTAGAGVTSVAG